MEENYKCFQCGNSEGGRDFVFYTMEAFIKHILQQGPKFNSVSALAHNASRFDSVFVARTLIEKERITPQIIAQGAKIIQMTVKNIVFRDTYLFMSVKLAKLPATMGLQGNLKKGDFPFLMNTEDNQNYNAAWPALNLFDVDGKSEAERDALKSWHKECEHLTFKC